MIAVEDYQVLVKDRATAKSVSTDELPDIGLPPDFAVKVDRRQHDPARCDLSWRADVRCLDHRPVRFQEMHIN